MSTPDDADCRERPSPEADSETPVARTCQHCERTERAPGRFCSHCGGAHSDPSPRPPEGTAVSAGGGKDGAAADSSTHSLSTRPTGAAGATVPAGAERRSAGEGSSRLTFLISSVAVLVAIMSFIAWRFAATASPEDRFLEDVKRDGALASSMGGLPSDAELLSAGREVCTIYADVSGFTFVDTLRAAGVSEAGVDTYLIVDTPAEDYLCPG